MVDQVRMVLGELDNFTEQVIRTLSVNITAELVETTPVDTGWARANWVPSIGSAFEASVVEFESDEQRASAVPGRSAEQQAGIASIATGYSLQSGPVFISNNVPYIVILNEGSSAQAPAAFVQAAIATTVMGLGRTGLT